MYCLSLLGRSNVFPRVIVLGTVNRQWCWDSQEQELPLLKHSGVSVAPVAANEKGASRSTGSLGVPELSLGMPPDLLQCENTNLDCTRSGLAEPNKQLTQKESQSKLTNPSSTVQNPLKLHQSIFL